MDRSDSRKRVSCFQDYSVQLELMLYREFQTKRQTNLTEIQVSASLRVKDFFLLTKNKVAFVKLNTGNGSVGILGLSMYVHQASHVVVLTSDIQRAKDLKKYLAFPLNESTFFEKAKLFKGNWSEDEKNDFLPACKLDPFIEPIEKFREEVSFVDGYAAMKKSREYVVSQTPLGLKFADLIIVEKAEYFGRNFCDLLINEYQREQPEGRMIFLTKSSKCIESGGSLYDPNLEAFNANNPAQLYTFCELF